MYWDKLKNQFRLKKSCVTGFFVQQFFSRQFVNNLSGIIAGLLLLLYIELYSLCIVVDNMFIVCWTGWNIVLW